MRFRLFPRGAGATLVAHRVGAAASGGSRGDIAGAPREVTPVDVDELVGLCKFLAAEYEETLARAEHAELLAAGYAKELRALRELIAQAEAKEAAKVDATAEWKEVCYLAGTALPEAVDEAIDLMRKNAALTVRAKRAELEADALAAAIVGDEFPETRTTMEDD